MPAMKFQDEKPLLKIIVKIIAELQPIRTMDIGNELEKNYRYNIPRKEILGILSYLKKRKRVSSENEKWKIEKKYFPQTEA